MDDNKYPGPYRATKLWNEAISIFRNGMPLKRHRKHIKHYDNCFTGGEAINWLQQTLRQNPNFGPDINREKTAQLLNKFYKVGVFQSVCSGSSDSLENFKENQLYQFCSRSPLRTMKLSALASISNQQLPKGKLLRRSASKCSEKAPKRSFSFQSNFMEGVKSRAASNQLRLMDTEEVWKTVVLGRFQALMGNMNTDDFLLSSQTSGLWIMKNAHAIDKEPLHLSFNQAQLFPRWILAAMKSLIDWPHQSGSITSSFQYVGFEKDVFRVIRDHFRNLEFPLITACLYESFINAYSYIRYIESVSHIETNEAKFQSAESKFPSKSLEDLFHNVVPVTKERYSKSERISHPTARESYQPHEATAISLNSSKVSSSNRMVADKVSPTKFDDSVSGNPSNMESLHFIKTDKLFSASLPPNTCFETAFTSESPVTRIIPRKLVEDIHLSHKQRCSKSLSRNASFVEPHSLSLGPNCVSVPSTSFSSKIKRNASAPNVTDSNFQEGGGQFVKRNPVRCSSSNVNSAENCSESLPSYTGFTSVPISNSDKHALLANQGKLKKSLPEESEEHIKRKKKIKSENVMKAQHVRNQSGGYINLALSYSADEIGKSECFDQLLGEDLDYNAALETLQNLMKCSSSYEERKPNSDSTCDEIGNLNYSSASSLWSYHTADSGEHSFHTPTPPSLSLQENDDVRTWACDIITTSGIQTLKGQQLGIEILQLLLLLLPPVNRYKLQLLLCFMSNIEENGRLVLEDGECTRNLLLDTFTNSILRHELPQQGDESISRHIVAFLLDNHEILFDVPSGLKAEVDLHLAQMNKQYLRFISTICNVLKAMEAKLLQGSNRLHEKRFPEEGMPKSPSAYLEYFMILAVLADLYSCPSRLTYCEQVSCEEFEEQKLTDSQQALAELLDQIIQDSKMASKEKKKRLKMFKEAYPHIYYRKFPENNKENSGNCSKHKGLLHFTSRLRL